MWYCPIKKCSDHFPLSNSPNQLALCCTRFTNFGVADINAFIDKIWSLHVILQPTTGADWPFARSLSRPYISCSAGNDQHTFNDIDVLLFIGERYSCWDQYKSLFTVHQHLVEISYGLISSQREFHVKKVMKEDVEELEASYTSIVWKYAKCYTILLCDVGHRNQTPMETW